MKKIVLIIVSVLALNGGSAQKVYKSSSIFILECEGMPAECYTKTAKPRTTTATNTTECTSTDNDIALWKENIRVAYKFEVGPVESNSLNPTSDNFTWLEAVNRCASKVGGNWRLPTMSEALLIYIMTPQLEILGYVPAPVAVYWQATIPRHSSSAYVARSMVWLNGVVQGVTASVASSRTAAVRCIRDL